MPPTFDRELTLSQRRILQLVADGFAYRDIGEQTGHSEQMIKNKMGAMLRKMGADNRAQAVAMGFRRGLLQ